MPPLVVATMPVTLPAVPPMERVEVESAVTLPLAPVWLPRMVLAPIVLSWERVSALVAMPSVTLVPPTCAPRVPLVTEMPEPTESEEVATAWTLFVPEP